MSTDIERVTDGMTNMHDVWADMLQAGLGCWLLQRKLGFAFLAPVIVVLGCGLMMVWLSRAAAKTQASWMGKIQSRVGMTSKVITHVKQVKISGIAQSIERLIQALRVDELSVGNQFRIVLVITSTISFAPQSMSAVLGFALAGRELDVSTMYESLSCLGLLTAPLSGFFQRIPAILSAFTCLERIQRYLETGSCRDFCVTSDENRIGRLSSASSYVSHAQTTTTVELQHIAVPRTHASSNEVVLSISNGSFAWKAEQTVLKDIDITLPFAQITFVIGPVASGKSLLCKAILGDIPVAAGEVSLHPSFSSIAFCDQVPFLISGTLRQNIVGHLTFDHARFNEVIWAAALSEDIAALPDGHDTDLGTNGTSLSGGQKARLSLAKALYDRSPLLVLDDVFSGLDNSTAARVFNRTFGPAGLLRRRGATALVCTHSMRHIPLANHIIALGPQGTIVEQGPYQSLAQSHDARAATILDMIQHDSNADKAEDAPQTLGMPRPRNNDAITKALDDCSRATRGLESVQTLFKQREQTLLFVDAGRLYLNRRWLAIADSVGGPLGRRLTGQTQQLLYRRLRFVQLLHSDWRLCRSLDLFHSHDHRRWPGAASQSHMDGHACTTSFVHCHRYRHYHEPVLSRHHDHRQQVIDVFIKLRIQRSRHHWIWNRHCTGLTIPCCLLSGTGSHRLLRTDVLPPNFEAAASSGLGG